MSSAREHRWGNQGSDGVRACNNAGCTTRVKDSFRRWQPAPRARWRKQARELIPPCTGKDAEEPLQCMGPGCENKAEGGRAIYGCDECGAAVCSECSETFGAGWQLVRCVDGKHINAQPQTIRTFALAQPDPAAFAREAIAHFDPEEKPACNCDSVTRKFTGRHDPLCASLRTTPAQAEVERRTERAVRIALCDMMNRLGFDATAIFHAPTVTNTALAESLFHSIREEEERVVTGATERLRIRVGHLEYERALGVRRERDGAALLGAVEDRMATELGGMVDGAPTTRTNYLQRVRALVSIEKEHARLVGFARWCSATAHTTRQFFLADIQEEANNMLALVEKKGGG